MGLSASRGESCTLFELTVGQTGGFRSYFQRFFGHSNQVLQLFDLVVSCFHLNCDSVFDFYEIEFGLREQYVASP